MTVIVASVKHREMAADTLIVWGYNVEGHARKIVRGKDGSIGGACGNAAECTEFLDWVERGRRGRLPKKVFRHMTGIVLTKGAKLLAYYGPLPDELTSPYHTIGCGGPFATVALDLGHSPTQACEQAMKHSIACGGTVDVLRLKKGK